MSTGSETAKQTIADHPPNELSQLLEADRTALGNLFVQALQETLFTNRSEVRPVMLGRIAASETEAILDFIRRPLPLAAMERGANLCQLGLSEQTVLRLGQTTRQFLLTRLNNNLIGPALTSIDTYHYALLQGFLQNREKVILIEQERIRSALQRTLSRYTVQMEVAAGVAGATTSILNLNELLHTAVGLIRERFDLYYIGIFLVDEDNRWAVLSATAGTDDHAALRPGYQLELRGQSLIGKCILQSEPQVVLDIDRTTRRFEDSLLPDTRSAAAIPLHSRGRVIGALTVQSRQAAAFSDLDVTALRLLSDQLANAIENARLFAELRHSEEQYRTILENIEEGYYELDLAGTFTFVNESTCSILGYAKDELVGARHIQFVNPDDVANISHVLDMTRRTGTPAKGIEYRTVRKDETDQFIETSASLIRNAAGEPVGIRGLLRDITSRKQAEEFAIERKALERSNRELEQFAYVASHDLQEPLRKVQAFSDRLKSKHSAALGSEGRDYLERMEVATSRMQSLINDLLTLSRVASKAQAFVPVDLVQVAREVLSDLEARIEQTGGHVEVGELPTVEADPLQMRQLLQNLIGNALKFHRPNGPPAVKVHGQLLQERRGTKNLGGDVLCQFTVEDNGIGFDEKYLDRIFQPFQRLHGRNEYEGTGIGLTICQRIVERHGGHIRAQSTPGQGATFVVTLPARHAKAEG